MSLRDMRLGLIDAYQGDIDIQGRQWKMNNQEKRCDTKKQQKGDDQGQIWHPDLNFSRTLKLFRWRVNHEDEMKPTKGVKKGDLKDEWIQF